MQVKELDIHINGGVSGANSPREARIHFLEEITPIVQILHKREDLTVVDTEHVGTDTTGKDTMFYFTARYSGEDVKTLDQSLLDDIDEELSMEVINEEEMSEEDMDHAYDAYLSEKGNLVEKWNDDVDVTEKDIIKFLQNKYDILPEDAKATIENILKHPESESAIHILTETRRNLEDA